MFDIDVKFNDSFYRKTNPSLYMDAFGESLEFLLTEVNEAIKKEAPVRTGNLRDGHYYTLNNNLEGTLSNDVEYAPYVIFGTSRQAPNNYPQRAINRINLSTTISSRFEQSLITRNIL